MQLYFPVLTGRDFCLSYNSNNLVRVNINLIRELKKMDVDNTIKAIISYMPDRISSALLITQPIYARDVQEITLRLGLPVCIYCADKRYYLTRSGLCDNPFESGNNTTTAEDIRSVFLRLCEHSVYSRQNEINCGYITAAGGARVGLCGTGVINDGKIVNIKNITTLSFRIPREVKDCSKSLLELIDPLRGVLICSAPAGGKTTLIRDMARRLSYNLKVSVIDERGELSAGANSANGFDLGFSDLYLYTPKGTAVINSIRSLSPDVLICDELGDKDDVNAVAYAARCGAAFIATVHASSIDDLRSRPVTRSLLRTGAFGYIVFLGDRKEPGTVKRIYEWTTTYA